MNNQQDERCAEKAKQRRDITFTLVGQDYSSPTTICEWIKQNIESAPKRKLKDALKSALAMRDTKHRKRAD